MKDAAKIIGTVFLYIAIPIGIIFAAVLFFSFGAQVAFTISPFINWLAGVLFVINIILLLFAFVPKARGFVGLVILISSYIYGLSAWIYGLAVTLALWGWLAVIIGLVLGGVGVVPIGMLASIFNGRWDLFWTLFFTLILTLVARVVGYLLLSSAENQNNNDIIEIQAENNTQRVWKDIE